ncbi:MAG: cytochrome c [Rhodobacter sp.]|jgi:cytochrome c556|nr:cytochrome c [Rhodobacter sp.]MCA3493213.1 cytochrome c [Rhodobacter sp.]MCA3499151.1 cytochrome c [Rhodobacter sp.]MCA3502908.1 cytochrome c [Rhodobacter sp.]MCA3517636.1 cytochrome c [Rhodobacter sp.]
MKPVTKTILAGTLILAGTAFAKEGVQDPAVKARMELMGVIAANTKVLGEMAGGKATFNAQAAATAKANLAAAAAEIPAKFEPQATDPVSDAKSDIWTNWDDFLTKSETLLAQAEALDTTSLESIQAGMGGIGGACKACHSVYKN